MSAAGAAWTSAGIAFCAFVAVVVFGVLNLKRASRGPEGSPRWSIEHAVKSRYELVQVGNADARDVKVEINGSARVDGDTEFPVFSTGQRASYLIATTMQTANPSITVTWQPRKGERKSWTSDLPRRG